MCDPVSTSHGDFQYTQLVGFLFSFLPPRLSYNSFLTLDSLAVERVH